MTRLGLLYNSALGVERDTAAAAEWWSKAARLRDADGQAMLGAAHHLGAGVARDPVAALAWLIRPRGRRAASSPTGSIAAFAMAVRRSSARDAEHRAALPLEVAEAVP